MKPVSFVTLNTRIDDAELLTKIQLSEESRAGSRVRRADLIHEAITQLARSKGVIV